MVSSSFNLAPISAPAASDSSVSVSVPAEGGGTGVEDTGMEGVSGASNLERRGSTRACHGPWNGLPSR